MQQHSNGQKQKQYDPDANVYIAGLPRNYNKEKLYRLFSTYGTVLRYKFVSPNDELKCPYGFVQFSHPICAQQAIQALNGYQNIEVSIAAVGRRALFKSEEPTNLYIENMPALWNNDTLTHVFGKFGHIVQSKITGNNVAFVRFETHGQALEAIHHLHKEEIEANKRLTVRFATCQHRSNRSRDSPALLLSAAHSYLKIDNSNNLYIKNLPSTYNQMDLERLFSEYGPISSATIINDSIGVAFVRYKSAQNAKIAIKQLNGSKPYLFDKEIVVKYAHFDIDKRYKNSLIHCPRARKRLLKEKKSNDCVIVSGYIRKYLSVTKYYKFVDIISAYVYCELLQRINRLCAGMSGICSTQMMARLVSFEQTNQMCSHEVHQIMQTQFTAIITSLYANVNAQLSTLSHLLHSNLESENERIEKMQKLLHTSEFHKQTIANHSVSAAQKLEIYEICDERERVRVWLTDTVHLEQYCEALIQNGYDDMESIRDMTDSDLSYVGIEKIGHKKKFLKYSKLLTVQDVNGAGMNIIYKK